MICEKCGFEFSEGRNCPECGALAIFVMEEEYQERKQEWEEENAPKEDVAPKKQLNIHVNPVILKKAIITVAVVCVIATAIFGLLRGIVGFFGQQRFTVVYDMGNSMNADKGGFEVYSVDGAIYSADGSFVYKDDFDKATVEGEIVSSCVSTGGKFGALVARIGDEMPEYGLYALSAKSATSGDSVTSGEGGRIRTSTGKISIVEVTGDGMIYFMESELGAYDVVLGTSIYLYNGEKCKLIAENVSDFEFCENEHEFIYYDSDLQAYLYANGDVEALCEGEEGYEFARTSTGAMYYVNGKGELYAYGKKNTLTDSGVTAGTIRPVANSERVTYVKDGALYCYGKSMKEPVLLVGDYDMYGERAYVVEKHDNIYCAYGGELMVYNGNGKELSKKSGIAGVYLAK